jgi:tRNA pseudouridine38-40 synthase
MQRRFKLVIAYDGAPFAGWQSQAHGKTVQDCLETAVKRVSGESSGVHGAGRTDTGVHAIGQCAHLDVTAQRFSPEGLQAALNGVLPPTIRILRCVMVSPRFHARFSAKGKLYRYRIWNGTVLPPLEHGRAWHRIRPLDHRRLRAALSKFEGRHDFVSFAANRGKPSDDTIRSVRSFRMRAEGACLTINCEGDGFLYKMVRMMVGAAVLCAEDKLPLADIGRRLSGEKNMGPRLVAPAHGLFLIRVRY